MKLNNPCALLSLQAVGFGIEVCYVKTDAFNYIELTLNAAVWSYEKQWKVGKSGA